VKAHVYAKEPCIHTVKTHLRTYSIHSHIYTWHIPHHLNVQAYVYSKEPYIHTVKDQQQINTKHSAICKWRAPHPRNVRAHVYSKESCTCALTFRGFICMYVYIYMRAYIYIFVCTYIYLYTYSAHVQSEGTCILTFRYMCPHISRMRCASFVYSAVFLILICCCSLTVCM